MEHCKMILRLNIVSVNTLIFSKINSDKMCRCLNINNTVYQHVCIIHFLYIASRKYKGNKY